MRKAMHSTNHCERDNYINKRKVGVLDKSAYH
jgi:hypothetical protein